MEIEEEMQKQVEFKGLDLFQTNIVKGAIDLDKDISEIMIPVEEMKSIKLEKSLSHRGAKRLARDGFSRLPVIKNNLVIGILLIKSLIGLEFKDNEFTLGDLVRDGKIVLRKPIFCAPNTKIINMLKDFKKGRSHMALVVEDPEKMEKILVHYE